MNSNEDVNTKAQEIAKLLAFAKENYPAIAPMVESRVNHWKRRAGGLIGIAVVACELVQLVLG